MKDIYKNRPTKMNSELFFFFCDESELFFYVIYRTSYMDKVDFKVG